MSLIVQTTLTTSTTICCLSSKVVNNPSHLPEFRLLQRPESTKNDLIINLRTYQNFVRKNSLTYNRSGWIVNIQDHSLFEFLFHAIPKCRYFKLFENEVIGHLTPETCLSVFVHECNVTFLERARESSARFKSPVLNHYSLEIWNTNDSIKLPFSEFRDL